LNHSALQIAYGNLSYFSKDPVGDSVPKSMMANQLNLLYICSDNLSFWGVYVQIG
jgi:hypothetical protein